MNTYFILSIAIKILIIGSQQTLQSDYIFQNYGYPKPRDLPILNRKIFKGYRVSIREHPYVVSVRRQHSHYITGTLLNNNVVITVAHPVYGVSTTELGVVSGENYSDRGRIINPVLISVFHDKFDPYTLANDLVLLRIYEDFFFKTSVKSIKIRSEPLKKGTQVFVTGWGRCDFTGKELCLPRSNRFYPNEIQDPMLRTVTFMVTNNSYCKDYERNDVPLKLGMICLGNSRSEEPMTSCLAVPGAPMVSRGRLSGVLSWGFGCGYTFDRPLVYVDLVYYRRWVNYNLHVLRTVSKSNLTMFQLATESYVLKQLMKQEDHLQDENLQESELQLFDIDLMLINLRGLVYDIRDFINEGKYHEQKVSMYSNMILMHKKNMETRRKWKMTYPTIPPSPFLGKESLRDVGLVIQNGSLVDEL